MTEKPRRLGRGLEALIAGANSSQPPAQPTSLPPSQSPLRQLLVADISPNPFQPRHDFKPEELTDLQNSMHSSGLLQPISVRPRADGGYELIAGERRFRAATRLGWTEITAIVKPLNDREMLTLALIENLQRADLNPLDEALGYQRLIDEFTLTQQQIADAVGKDRSTVANLLRVLQLPEGIRRLVRTGQISLGHARALLALPSERQMLETARRIVDQGLSVRDVERSVQDHRPQEATPRSPRHDRAPAAHTPELRRLTELLRRRLQTDVNITVDTGSKGDISVRFYSSDDLHRLLELLLNKSLDDA